MEQSPGHGRRRQQRDAENDVGQLAHGGVGEPRLQVVLAQGYYRSDEDRDGDEIRGGQAEMQAVHQVHAENVEHHAHGGEHAHLYHGDGVEQRAHGRRGDHRAGQPVVQRHDAIFRETQDAADVEDDDDAVVDVGGQYPGVRVGGEIERPREDIDQDHGRQDEPFCSGGQVDEVFLGALVALLILVVRDKRVGRDADDLVEEIEREEIVGKRAADRTEEGEGKAGVETRLGMLLEAAHVAGRIKHRDHPQERGGDGEDHRERVGAQREA